VGQTIGGGFDGRGGRRDRSHDRADRLFERVGHLAHRLLPLGIGLLLRGDLGSGQLAVLDQLVAEHGECVADRADFIAALEAGAGGFEIALRQPLHARGDLN
jgi:hypothetical protein